MKKILLGTTAIVALTAITSEALAADPISLSLGGFQKFYVGIASDEDSGNLYSDFGMNHDSEVYFKGSTTLDNGVTVGVVAQLETNTNATDSIDQNYITLSSDGMGTLTLGSSNDAFDALAVAAPSAGPLGWGDGAGWAYSNEDASGGNDLGSPGGNETIKFKYISPDFNGMTAGVSYTVGTADQANGRKFPYSAMEDQVAFAAAYSGEMGGAAVDASLAHYFGQDSVSTNAIGVNVSMSGFTVGGSYQTFDGEDMGPYATTTGTTNTRSGLDGKGYDIGASYETGAYTLSAAYMNSTAQGATTAGDNETTEWVLGVAYDLGAGVALVGNYYDQDITTEGGTTTDKISGMVAGIEISF